MFFSIAVRGEIGFAGLVGLVVVAEGGETEVDVAAVLAALVLVLVLVSGGDVARDTPPHLAERTYSRFWWPLGLFLGPALLLFVVVVLVLLWSVSLTGREHIS